MPKKKSTKVDAAYKRQDQRGRRLDHVCVGWHEEAEGEQVALRVNLVPNDSVDEQHDIADDEKDSSKDKLRHKAVVLPASLFDGCNLSGALRLLLLPSSKLVQLHHSAVTRLLAVRLLCEAKSCLCHATDGEEGDYRQDGS